MATAFKPILSLAAAAALFGCDPGEQCEPNDIALPEGVDPCDPDTYPAPTPTDTGSDVTQPIGTYPSQGIGVEEGDTIANLSLTTVDGDTFSFEDDVFRDPSVRLLLVSTAAGWCPGCREEQPTLVELYNDHRDDGLLVIVPVFEDNNASVVTQAFAEGWRDQYGLPFPVLLDPLNDFAPYYDPNLAPLNMFVDGETMEIRNITIGVLDESTAQSFIDAL